MIEPNTSFISQTALFIGHAKDYRLSADVLDAAIENMIQGGISVFYNGGKGHFDGMCASSVNRLKKKYPHVSHYLILPYLNFNGIDRNRFDGSIYPELETVPKKFAYSYRNQWMVRQASQALCFVNHRWGGAYQTFRYAVHNGLEVTNLGNLPLDEI